jgi:Holliday junction resolvasome RuvABC endonuclease subunit
MLGEFQQKLVREEVLSIDPGIHMGYFCAQEHGLWNLEESKSRNGNKQHGYLHSLLMDIIRKHGIRQMVVEDLTVNEHFTDARKLGEFRGIILEVCDEMDLPEPAFVNCKTLKKWATGNGNATKEDMVRYCQMRYHIDPERHDVADAAHLYYYYIRKFRL